MSFSIGQRVICVWAYDASLVQNGIYVVAGTNTCCRDWVSLEGLYGGDEEEACPGCGAYAPEGAQFDFYVSEAFRPLDALTEQIERIQEEGAPIEHELLPA